MFKIILINGLIAAAIIAGVSSLMLWSAGSDAAHSQSEWLGYVIMVAGLSVIYVAIRQVRDQQFGGVIGFFKALQVGMTITLIAAVFYVGSWELYYRSAGQDFIAQYQQSQLDQLAESGASEAAIEASRQEMAEFARWYERWYIRALITLLEILPVGVLISLISATLLRTRQRG